MARPRNSPPTQLAPTPLRPDLGQALFEYSNQHDIPYNAVVLEALREYLSQGLASESPPRRLPAQDLTDDLASDLFALSEAHFGAPYSRLVEAALRQFIDVQTSTEGPTRQRFNEARARLNKRPTDLRVIDTGRRQQRDK
jgi:hypothetical protein